MVNRDSVLAFFRDRTRKPLSFKDIILQMRLSRPEARALKRVLRELLRSGDLILSRRGLYGPAVEMDLVTGHFEAHRDGYGFLIIDKPGERDLFVPARYSFGAMNGDRVVARVEDYRKREARIIRVLDRAVSRITGTIEITRTATFLRPKNKRIPFDLYVSPADRDEAHNGDLVTAEILTYPSDKRSPSARVIRVLRKPEDPATEVDLIIEEFNLPHRFPRAVHAEAKLLSAGPREHGTLRRKDLRGLHTVTIDGERAKDFDDAVSIALTEHGYRLWVHIADVGHYVAWDSAIDDEARRRGTSVYFPDRVIPMLPKELSEDLCSLKPRVDRFAFTAEMDFDRNGVRSVTAFYPSLIRSDERMTYTSVRKIVVDRDETERKRYDHLLEDLELMNELASVLREKRLGRGSLDFDLPEPEVLLDLRGMPEAVIKAERNLAHMLIEEFMIAANEAVAEHIQALGVPSLYRIHEEPDVMRMEEISRVLKPLAGLRRRILRPRDIPRLLADIKGAAGEEVINFMILRSLKQARYSAVNVGHFGLASACYTHFTSPIRRYPDLVVHRILRELLGKRQISDKRAKELEALLPDIAFHASRMERLADDAEREVITAMRVWFMKDKLGQEYEGVVVSIAPFGLRVRLKEFYVEGFVHVSYLTDDFYHFDEKSLALTGRNTRRSYTVGTPVRVRVDRVDRQEREISFSIIGPR